nr:hypothetical protein [Lachnospiraceae bacterium]
EPFYQDLNLVQVIDRLAAGWGKTVRDFYSYLPGTQEDVEYRRAVYGDIKKDDVYGAFIRYTERMAEVERLRGEKDKVRMPIQKAVWQIREVSEYCGAYDELEQGLQRAELSSGGMKRFLEILKEIMDAGGYRDILGKTQALIGQISELRFLIRYDKDRISVEIGSVPGNGEYAKMLKSRGGKDIRPFLNPFRMEPELTELEKACLEILIDKKRDFFHELKNTADELEGYEKPVLKRFEEEILFYLSFGSLEREMSEKGFVFTTPETSADRRMEAKGLYDLALALSSVASGKKVVANDFCYEENERFFVLTGPNQGGKTTFARSLGQLVYLSRIGLDVPAASAVLPFFPFIRTHFSVEESVETGRGKLKEELVRLAPMMEEDQRGAFVIINELFTTAANYDAQIMGKKVLSHFLELECMGIYVTHLAELAAAREGIVSLRATLDDNRVQTFKILRGEAEDTPCADNLVNKYGLTYEKLKERLKQPAENDRSGKEGESGEAALKTRVCLLYEDREWAAKDERYYDNASIIQDLGLKALFLAAAKRLVYENGAVKSVEKEDPYLADTLRAVMMIPLKSAEQIKYRQDIIRDCIGNEGLIRNLYGISCELIAAWTELGRGPREKIRQNNPVIRLTNDIRELELFCDALSGIKKLFAEYPDISSRGLCSFRDQLSESFSDEREEYVRSVLADISFYTDRIGDPDERRLEINRPRIVLECGLEDGLKFSSLKLEEVSSQNMRYLRPGSARQKIQGFIDSRKTDSFSAIQDPRINEQAHTLEFMIVSYLTGELKWLAEEFQTFFDRLRYQTAFYLAAFQLAEQMARFKIEWCYPEVCDRRDIEFSELKEFVMGLEQRAKLIGNTCSISGKDLLIVTGANQGGKSTFLRSIGIAQVMMQCGLMVTAQSYTSGIFPRIFVHFTRREDSAMNSGRLDEELNRMNRIVENIGDGSLLLLNESFATTTEKEGSVIAYDIIRALNEAGVRIFTVTHLLSFAKRVYEEEKESSGSGAEFLSAERKADGTRTFRMIPHEPELTSFGLDLYEEIVEKKRNKK